LTNQVAYYIGEMAKENRVVLIATHDMNLATKLDGVIFLIEHGMIVESVKTEDYKINPTHYPFIQTFIN